MTIRQHPSLTLRSDYVAGTLPPGAALAVAAHLRRCAVCSIAVETMSAPHPRRKDPQFHGLAGENRRSFAARPDRPAPAPVPEAPSTEEPETWEAGRWWFMGPGLRIAQLKGVSGLGEAVHLIKARAGARLPLGRGIEHVLLLEGGLSAGGESYEAGDFLEISHAPLRAPVAGAPHGCMFLVVSEDDWPRSRLLRFLLSLGRSDRSRAAG